MAYKGGTLPAMLFKHFKIPMIFSLEISNYGAGYSTLFKQTDYIKIGQEYCDIMGLYFAKKLYVGPK